MTSKEAIQRIKDDIEIGYLSTKHDNQKDKENYLVMLKIIEKDLELLEKLKHIRYPSLEREKQVLDLRKEGKTLEEIAKMFGVTRERIRQIEVRAIRRKALENEIH